MDIKTLKELSEILDKVTVSLINGLLIQGDLHKQYYLEQAMFDLCGDAFVKKSKAEFQWDNSIVP